jgi:hypothetical protein
MKGSQPLVVYRIYYKLMKTTLEPQALVESPKGQKFFFFFFFEQCRISLLKKQN